MLAVYCRARCIFETLLYYDHTRFDHGHSRFGHELARHTSSSRTVDLMRMQAETASVTNGALGTTACWLLLFDSDLSCAVLRPLATTSIRSCCSAELCLTPYNCLCCARQCTSQLFAFVFVVLLPVLYLHTSQSGAQRRGRNNDSVRVD